MKKFGKNLGVAAAALALSLSAGTALGQVTNVVYQTDFEQETANGRPDYTYGYQYSWGYGETPPLPVYIANSWYLEPDSTNGLMMQFTFDNSLMTPEPEGAGYGVGFGGVLKWLTDVTAMGSTNRVDYIIEFDARVEGLLPDQLTANAQFQVRFDVPDDSIQPPDGNTDPDTILQVNFDIHPGSNWTHYAYTLDQGGIGGGSERLFAQYLYPDPSLVLPPRFGVNLHQPDAQFGWDGYNLLDNALYIDNIKLSVVIVTNPPPPPVVGFPIIDWNFDDKPLVYSWSGAGWSQNGIPAAYTVNHAASGMGVGGTNAYVMGMDNSMYAAPNTPGWAGGNTGGGGPGNYTLFDTSDLGSYRVSFDARVEGLAPDRLLTSGGGLQMFLNVPDDTIQPPDGDTNPDNVIRLDYTLSDLETNWQTYSFLMNKMTFGNGNRTTFTNDFHMFSELTFQFQIQNAASADWSYDSDNLLIIDNFKVERLVVGCPPLTITPSGADMVLTWAQPNTGTSKLQSSSNLGVWTDVPGATSGYTIPAASAPKYFRTQWVPPTP